MKKKHLIKSGVDTLITAYAQWAYANAYHPDSYLADRKYFERLYGAVQKDIADENGDILNCYGTGVDGAVGVSFETYAEEIFRQYGRAPLTLCVPSFLRWEKRILSQPGD